ncbi:MAG: PAS domain S-box protein [candidate division Zixibacteria bacterium]|nr:PAS domain S-box protein [candidate division Zixibacteria bacterium]
MPFKTGKFKLNGSLKVLNDKINYLKRDSLNRNNRFKSGIRNNHHDILHPPSPLVEFFKSKRPNGGGKTEQLSPGAIQFQEYRWFQAFIDNIPIMVDAFDENNVIILWNKECERITGYSKEEIVNNPRGMEILYPDPQYRNEMFSAVTERSFDFRGLEWELTCKDGSKKTISWYNVGESLSPPGWGTWAVGIDVTERKRAEKLLNIQKDLSMKLNLAADFESALNSLLDSALEIDFIDCGGIYRVDHEKKKIRLVAHKGLSERFIESTLEFGFDTPQADIALKGTPVYSIYKDLISDCDKPRRDESIKGISVFPIKYGNNVIASLNIASKTSNEIPVWARDTIQAIASMTGDVINRIEIQDQLQETVSQLDKVLTSMSDGFFILDNNMIITYFNPAAEKLLGRKREDVIGFHIFDEAFPEAKGSIFDEKYNLALKTGERVSFEAYFDKEPYSNWYEVRAFPFDEGLAIYFLVTTERKRVEEALIESEKRFRNIFEQAGDVVFVHDFEGKILEVNQKFVDVFGYTREEALQMTCFDAHSPDPESQEAGKKAFRELIETGIVNFESDFIRKSGEVFAGEVSASLLTIGNRQFVQGVFRDITARKKSEEALKRSEEKYRNLFETMAQGVVYHDRDGNITSANPAACRILGLTLDQMLGRDSMDPRWRAIRADGSDFPGNEHPSMEALRTGCEVRNVMMGVFNPNNNSYSWIQVNAVPEFRNADNKPHRVYTTFEDVTEQKNLENALRESRNRYRLATNAAKVGVWDWNIKTGEFYLDPIIKAFLGYEDHEIPNDLEKWNDYVHPEDREMVMDAVQKHLEGRIGEYKIEHRMVHRNGSVRWVLAKGQRILGDDGNVVRLIGTDEDITHRKLSEKALRESELRYRTLFEKTANPIMVIDKTGRYIDCNEAALEFLECNRHELIGREVSYYLPPDFDPDTMSKHKSLWETGGNIETEYFINGRIKILELSITPIDWRGEHAVIGLGKDITDRVEAERALRDSEERYRTIFDNSALGIFEYSIDGKIINVNQAYAELYGYESPAEVFEAIDDVGKHFYVFPEKRNEIIREVTEKRGVLIYENLYRRKDGSEFVGNLKLEAVRDETGNILYLFGFVEDITERRKFEDELRRKEREFRTLAENAPDIIARLDREYRHIYVNPVIEQSTGLGPEFFIGKSHRDLGMPEEIANTWISQLENVFQSREKKVHNFDFNTPGGKRYYESLVVPEFDDYGEVNSVLGITRDITDRIKAEEELKASLKEKEVLLKELHHRVKNNLQIVSSLLGFQSQTIQNEEAKAVFRDSQARIKSIGLIHEQLYRESDLSRINFRKYIEELIYSLHASFGIRFGKIELEIETNDVSLSLEQSIPCGMIVNEIVSNSLKHAFPGDRKGKIKIYFESKGNLCYLNISDDGVGLPEGFELELQNTMGMQLIILLTKQLKGEVEHINENGTRFKIEFPLKSI